MESKKTVFIDLRPTSEEAKCPLWHLNLPNESVRSVNPDNSKTISRLREGLKGVMAE